MYSFSKNVNSQLYWNFIYLLHDKKIIQDVIIIRGPIKKSQNLFYKNKTRNSKIIGCSSFSSFPRPDGYFFDPDDYMDILATEDAKIIAWCHCFSDPKQYFSDSIPLIFISESDMLESSAMLQGMANTVEKKYDFIVNLPEGEWNSFVRNLPVAQRWLNHMAEKLDLKILVIGKNRKKDFSTQIDVLEDFLPQKEFWMKMASTRALFVASQYDASPCIITEALSLDIPILVNRNILGGWKYVQDTTGMFFDPTEDIEERVQSFLRQRPHFRPLDYARENLDLQKNINHLSLALNVLFQRQFSDYLDGVVYINLEKRKDRLKSIRHQLQKMGIQEAVRIKAIPNPINGHLGCAQSHVEALQYAKQQNWKRFLVLEDDFVFVHHKERTLYMLDTFIREVPDWNVLMLGYEYPIPDTDFHCGYEYIKKWSRATTTTGYFVNEYTDVLLDNFQEAVQLLKKQTEIHLQEGNDRKILETPYAIDRHWGSLQKKDAFFGTLPKLGTTNQSYSSIMTGVILQNPK